MRGDVPAGRFELPAWSTWALALLAASLLAVLALLRHVPERLQGDEGTYAAMVASLVRDGDLRFGAADARWARERASPPVAVILERTSQGIAYSKPVLYPLVVAPFAALAGEWGFPLAHLVLLAAALALARAALARRGGGERAAELLAGFVVASTVAVYLGWKMSESLQVALATAGLALTLGRELGPGPAAPGRLDRWLDAPAAPWIGAALLGLLVSLREPNGAVAAVPVLAALAVRHWRRAAGLAASVAAAYLAMLALSWTLTGAVNPYKSTRTLFDARTGYPGEAATESSGSEAGNAAGNAVGNAVGGPAAAPADPVARFDEPQQLRTSSLGATPDVEPLESVYSGLYFVAGRHTGVLLYFPVVVALVAALRHGGDRVGGAAAAGFVLLALFYLVWWPGNYFGGETCVGNRYQLAALPCLLFVPRRLPSRRALAASWTLALLVGGSALASVVRTRAADPLTQNHAHAGLFRVAPYESTMNGIDGVRDRYWAYDFLRFADPYADVGATSFELATDRPGADVEIATTWAGDRLHWLVVADAPDAELVVSDWARRKRLRLDGAGGASGGPLELRPSPAWRLHRFWWPSPEPYHVRVLRLRLATRSGRPAHARVRYLGRWPVPASGFAPEVLDARLPAAATAGAPTRLRVELVNHGTWTWRSDFGLQTMLGVRMMPLDGGAPIDLRVPLPHEVPPTARVIAWVDLRWPERPGRYRVVVDLVVEDVAWFADRVGSPLAERIVSVLPAPPAAAAPSAPAPH